MHVTIPRRTLSATLGIATKAVNGHATNTALRHVLLIADAKGFRIEGTDLYLGISATAEGAIVAAHGGIAIPAKEFVERINVMQDGPITIVKAQGAERIQITGADKRKFGLLGLAAETFTANATIPRPPEDDAALTMPAEVFLRSIARTFYVLHTDETQAQRNSAFTQWSDERGGTFRMVSLSGHMLSLVETFNLGFTTKEILFLPRKGAELCRASVELAKAMAAKAKPAEGEAPKPLLVRLYGGAKLFVVCGGITTSVALFPKIDFARYEKVIRARAADMEKGCGVVMPKARIIESLRAMNVSSTDGNVTMTFRGGNVTVSAQDANGIGIDEFAVDYSGGDTPRSIILDCQSAIATMSAIDSDSIFMGMSTEQPGVTIFSPDPEPTDERQVSFLQSIAPPVKG